MKTITTIILAAIFMIGAVSATNGVLSEEFITMGYDDTRVVEFCLYNNAAPVANFPIVVGYVWQEFDNVLGYSVGDTLNPTGFMVTPLAATTDANGCVDLQLDTSDEDGTYGYQVAGWNGLIEVGTETGTVQVPEFGVLAAIGVLAIAGLFIYKKRD